MVGTEQDALGVLYKARRGHGEYVLERWLGQGGMATVFEARHRTSGRRVALKILREDHASPETLRRLFREAALLRRLDHPNVVRLLDAGSLLDPAGRRLHYLALDFHEGRTLADLLQAGEMERDELVGILLSVANTVAYLHERGILHRDLKPSNVLIEPSGRVLLMDFGLACARTLGRRLTLPGVVLGTPLYLAPESLLERRASVDPRSEVYSLGIVLYEILAGRVPFDDEDVFRLYRRIRWETPPPPSALRPGPLEDVCLKALRKDPAKRQVSVREFARELTEARGSPDAAAS